MSITPGRTYYGEAGNGGRRAYTVETVTGTRTVTRQQVTDGQFASADVTRTEVTARRYYPSTGRTAAQVKTYYLPCDAEEITR